MNRLRNLPLLLLAFAFALLLLPVSALAEAPLLTPLYPVSGFDWGGAYKLQVSGGYAVAGANQMNARTGEAYILAKSGASWSVQQKLFAPGGATGDDFGWSVDIDGDTAVVGAPVRDSYTGSVYVFVRTGTSWTLQTTLNGSLEDSFGTSVAIDGNRLIVGAPTRSEYGTYAGMVYIFERVGSVWSETARIVPPVGAPQQFGTTVAVDGDTVVAGPYVFVRSGTQWVQQAYLNANGPVELEQNTLVVGAQSTSQVYVFTRTGSTWSRTATLAGISGSRYGASVSVSGDYLGVGAPWENTAGWNYGAVYCYHRSGATWNTLFKGVPRSEVSLGWGIGLDGSQLLATGSSGPYAVWVLGFPPDTTPPVSTALGVPDGWVRDDVSVTLAASDSGSGVASTFYALDGGLPSAYSMPFAISREGTSSISYWSVDASGNIEPSKTAYVRIDRSSPDPIQPELSAWSPSGCTLSWPAGRDVLSGVSYYRIYRDGSLVASTSALTWSDSGLAPSTAYRYRVSAVDAAGNESIDDAVIRYVTPHVQGEPSVVDVPATDGASVQIPGGGSVQFDDPGSGGQLEIAPVTENHEPANFRMVRGAYYDIHPNFTFAGVAYVTLPYDPAEVSGNAERLKLFHWKNNGWEDITVSVDTENHTITGRTSSFSEFALGESAPLEVGTPASSGWSLGIAAVIMAIVTVRMGRGRKVHLAR